ncbi:uncharacterized protein PHACADRAFT_260210 [Phanerochaete carnosa HHB-10118-sp]|uniref:ATP phosphoribosyltransferase n=1 Tax=Phanerochaete carnosa (strain HHB-10118-sp) TaxID=650164 RepID=K5W3L4_PHACS|nr:uncharacterized protein PHACADRAFT_260210 [Phanerochaete carnosa HHB-10118-sp]EKM53720.1 hypothetical protein PHACADRAFT_260210 [Phanerochaete carnosa HHB-10118-sp]
MSRFKLVFFAPVRDTSRILNHLFSKYPQTVGKIGQYESCAFLSRGTGQFRPGPEANPAIGKRGELEFVEENRVEVIVNDKGENEEIRGAIKELKAVSSYTTLVNLGPSMSIPMVRFIRTKKSHMMFTALQTCKTCLYRLCTNSRLAWSDSYPVRTGAR